MKNIAVINLGYIGDVVNASPVCSELKKAYPDSKLIFITVPSSVETAKCLPSVDEVIVFDRYNEHKGLKIFNLAFKIRQKYKLDAAFLLTDNFRCALFSFLIGAKKRIGRSNEGRDILLTHKIPFTEEERNLNVHVTEQYMRVLKPLELYNTDYKLGINYTDKDNDFVKTLLSEPNSLNYDLIGLCPATGHKIKDWNVNEAAELIKCINQMPNKKVVIVGTNASKKFAEELRLLGIDNFIDTSCKTTISQLAALINKFTAFVSIDSAPMHFGFTLKISTVSLFFQNNYKKWGPRDSNINRLIYNPNGIKASDVIEKLNELLKRD